MTKNSSEFNEADQATSVISQDDLTEAQRKEHKREIHRKAQKKYDDRMSVLVAVKLNRGSDADIIPLVEGKPDKPQIIRKALRLLLKQQQEENEQTSDEAETK